MKLIYESIVRFFQLIIKYCNSFLQKNYVNVKSDVLILSQEEKYINDIEKKFQKSYDNVLVEWSDNIYELESVAHYFEKKSLLVNNNLEKKWKSRILFESTPRGNIIMMYDTYVEAFVYYLDTSGTPYKLLNAVAMKYVLTFYCRDFFVDENKIPISFTSPFIKNRNDKDDFEKKKKVTFFNELTNGVPENSPFAKLKTRVTVLNNTKKTELNRNDCKIQNRFISRGKICNYSFLQKFLPTKTVIKEITYKSQMITTNKNYDSDNGFGGISSMMDF